MILPTSHAARFRNNSGVPYFAITAAKVKHLSRTGECLSRTGEILSATGAPISQYLSQKNDLQPPSTTDLEASRSSRDKKYILLCEKKSDVILKNVFKAYGFADEYIFDKNDLSFQILSKIMLRG